MIDSGVFPNSPFETETAELSVTLQNQSAKSTKELLQFLSNSNRKLSLNFIEDDKNNPMVDLSSLVQGNIKKFHIQQSVLTGNQCLLMTRTDVLLCPHLTHLSLTSPRLHIQDSVFKALSNAVEQGNLPNLSHLSFADSGDNLKNKLSLLFQTEWPTLKHLDLSGCELDHRDVQIVFGATDPTQTNLLPALSSIAILPEYFMKKENLFKKPWPRLTNLEMIEKSNHANLYWMDLISIPVKVSVFPTLTEALNNGILPNLTSLKLSRFYFERAGGLDLCSFASVGDATARGNIDVKVLVSLSFTSGLFHLDLSYNSLAGRLLHLLCIEFPNLQSLNLRGCDLKEEDMRFLAQVNVQNNLPKTATFGHLL